MTPLLACWMLVLVTQSAGPSASPQSAAPPTAAATPAKPADSPEDLSLQLLHVRRIYVDSFGDDPLAKQIQASIIDGLTQSKRFIITENKDKADAVLKGTGLEKTSQEYHSHSEGTAVGTAAGGHSGSVNGTFVGGTGSVSGSSSGGFVAHSAATEDSNASTETINDARVAVRLVDKDGDVIWSTTQESHNAKYKSATADVADKVVKQLLWTLEKLEKHESAATRK